VGEVALRWWFQHDGVRHDITGQEQNVQVGVVVSQFLKHDADCRYWGVAPKLTEESWSLEGLSTAVRPAEAR